MMVASERWIRIPASLVAVLAIAGLLISAPGVTFAEPIGPPDTGEAQQGGEWTIAITEEPDTLDPQKSGTAITAAILDDVCDPLIAENFDGEYVPGLATEWTISPDGLTWSFVLREDVTFHDGTPMNAAAVEATFARALDPATKSPIAGSLLGPVESARATGDFTFELKLREPFAPLLENLTDDGRLCILSPQALAQAGDDFGRKPVGTGPWMVYEWRSGDRIVLKQFPNYNWAPPFLHQGPAYIETITYRIMPEEAARMAAFEAGEVDQTAIAPTDVERIKADDAYYVAEFLRKGVVFLEFNTTQAPFDDPKVRAAMNYAIDKTDVLDAALEGLGQVAHGFLPPSLFGYWPGIEQYAPAYDPERTKALLAEAGWTDSDGNGDLDKNGQPFQFVAYTLPTDTFTRTAQVVQSQLKGLGIEMEIQTLEFGALLDQLKAGDFQASFMGYTYEEPDIAYLWFHSSNIGTGLAHSHFRDQRLDELIVQARSTIDPNERAKLYEELQRYITDQALWVPLWINFNYIGLNKRIHNAQLHPDGDIVLFDAWVE